MTAVALRPVSALPVARSIYSLPLVDIDASGGLRPLDHDWVAALAVLIDRDGQEEPIKVYALRDRPGYGVTAGRHRYAALKLLGRTFIDCDLQDKTALDRRSAEVSENLFKLGLSPLDRAAFIAEQVSIEQARAGVDPSASPQSVAATARWSDRIKAEADDASLTLRRAYGFADDVAEQVGLSRASIYRALELHRGLRPEVIEAIRPLPLARNATQLRALALLPEDEQRRATQLLTGGEAKTVSAALDVIRRKPVKSAAQKATSAILGNWTRLSAREQRDVLRLLALPKGVTLTIEGEVIGGGHD